MEYEKLIFVHISNVFLFFFLLIIINKLIFISSKLNEHLIV
jgi:hypothetical protein